MIEPMDPWDARAIKLLEMIDGIREHGQPEGLSVEQWVGLYLKLVSDESRSPDGDGRPKLKARTSEGLNGHSGPSIAGSEPADSLQSPSGAVLLALGPYLRHGALCSALDEADVPQCDCGLLDAELAVIALLSPSSERSDQADSAWVQPADAATPVGHATPSEALSSSPESIGVTGVSIGARLRELVDTWRSDNLAIHRKYTDAGVAKLTCADELEAALWVGEPPQPETKK